MASTIMWQRFKPALTNSVTKVNYLVFAQDAFVSVDPELGYSKGLEEFVEVALLEKSRLSL